MIPEGSLVSIRPNSEGLHPFSRTAYSATHLEFSMFVQTALSCLSGLLYEQGTEKQAPFGASAILLTGRQTV